MLTILLKFLVYRSIFQRTFASARVFTAGQQNAWVKHLLARIKATPQPVVDSKTEEAYHGFNVLFLAMAIFAGCLPPFARTCISPAHTIAIFKIGDYLQPSIIQKSHLLAEEMEVGTMSFG